MTKKSEKRKSQQRRTGGRRAAAAQMVFTRRNYILVGLGVAMIVIGYTAMRLENEMDGFISLYVAPLIILGGYLEIIYAILWRPRPDQSEAPAQNQG
jgi:membrane glycosyltransferase